MLVHANETVSSDRLITHVWGDGEPESAANALQVHVFHLRRALGPERTILTSGHGYTLAVEPAQIDARRFEQGVSEGREALERGETETGARILESALSLWRGSALSDFQDDVFAQTEIARLEGLRLATLEERIEAEISLGGHADLIELLEDLVAKHPARESFRAQLMIALYRVGRQAEALEVFQAARRFLVGDLGIEPGVELQRVQRAILTQDEALQPNVGAGPSRPRVIRPGTSLVGRERERAEVIELVCRDDVRLVSLTGPPGIGKTRLAQEVAVALEETFRDGAVMVELAALRDPALVPSAIARALEVEEDVVEQALASRRGLLVLDNFEHLLPAADFLVELLRSSSTRLLVTSRVDLHLSLEHDYCVPPLEMDDAVELFVKRARSQDPGFRLTEDNAGAVGECVERLDRLPLAIELAAARSRLLSPQQMVDRLERRLEVLTEGPRDLPPRHRTLRAAIDWSHDLLSLPEQEVFRRLAVFSGGWTLAAAEAICEVSLDNLASLLDKSLIRRDGERFSMLETLREYACEQLERAPESVELRRAHAGYFISFAEEARTHLLGEEQAVWLARLEADHDNFRAALAHLLEEGEAELALRLTRGLVRFWFVRGHWSEGRIWAAKVLAEHDGLPGSLVIPVLAAAGLLADRQGDRAEGKRLVEQSLALSRSEGDLRGVARCLMHLGSTALGEDRLDEARRLFDEAAELYRELDEAVGSAIALNNLGELELLVGNPAAAAESFRQALRLHRERGNTHGVAISLQNLAMASLQAGHADEALPSLEECLALWEDFGERHEIAYCLQVFAAAASGSNPERAASLVGAAQALRDSIGASLEPYERRLCEETHATLVSRLGAAGLDLARTEGRRMTPDEAIVFARETVPVG